MVQRIRNFFEESRQELRHVNWPTREEAIRLTTVVVAFSLALALLLGGFDYLFSASLRYFVLSF